MGWNGEYPKKTQVLICLVDRVMCWFDRNISQLLRFEDFLYWASDFAYFREHNDEVANLLYYVEDLDPPPHSHLRHMELHWSDFWRRVSRPRNTLLID